jgi:hypothetical protein
LPAAGGWGIMIATGCRKEIVLMNKVVIDLSGINNSNELHLILQKSLDLAEYTEKIGRLFGI